jgi:hypothetical protein
MPIFVHFCEHFRVVHHHLLCVQIFINFSRTLYYFLSFVSSWTNIHRLFASILSLHLLCKQVNFFFLYILAYCSVSIDFLAYILDSLHVVLCVVVGGGGGRKHALPPPPTPLCSE